jgi:hypothetical protein
MSPRLRPFVCGVARDRAPADRDPADHDPTDPDPTDPDPTDQDREAIRPRGRCRPSAN